jgi:hypothetical protein
MGQRVIAENAGVVSVTYKLPNKHYIPVNMNYIGVDNTTPLSIIRFFIAFFCLLLTSFRLRRLYFTRLRWSVMMMIAITAEIERTIISSCYYRHRIRL